MPKNLKFIYVFLIVLTLTLTAFAQRKPVKPAPTPARNAQRLADEANVAAMDDPGYDLAVVVKDGAIRETPTATGKLVVSVKRNSFLSVVDRAPQGNFYRVVQSDTGDEGWIDGNLVVIKLTGSTETGPPLEEAAAATANAPPEVTIENEEENTTLRIRLNGKLYYIPPGTSKTVPVAAGKFTYYGWSPGIRPATGKSVLEKGKKYKWTFKIYR